jgi:hypothetical protein
MFLDQPVNDLTIRPQRRKRPFLVSACRTAETTASAARTVANLR